MALAIETKDLPEAARPFHAQIQEAVKRTDKKADKYRNAFYIIRIGLVVISGTITIVSGWKSDWNEDCIFNLLLVLGTLTTVITAVDTLFQIETKKNVYKLMLVELKEIRSALEFHSATKKEDELTKRIDDHLFPKFQAIMAYSKSLIDREEKDTTSTETSAKPGDKP